MSGTEIRVADLADLGTVADTMSVVGDTGTMTGRITALSLKSYCATTTLPEAPFTNQPYGRQNGAWTLVLPEAPQNSVAYGRMNATWTAVLPEAPLSGSTYGRAGGGWTPVLPITGGSLSGGLNVSGNIATSTGVYANQYSLSSSNGYEWQFYIQSGSGHHIQQHRAGWYDYWDSSSGTRSWVGPSGTQMTLDGAGNLVVTGNISAPYVTSNGSINATGAATAAQFWINGTSNTFGFTPGAGGRIFQFSPAFYLEFVTANATLQWNVSNGPLWVMRAADDFCFNPQSSVGGNGSYLNISDRRAKQNIAPTTKGLAEVLQLQPVSFTRTDPTTGHAEEIGLIAQDVQPIVPEAVWQAGIPLRDGTGGLDSGDPTLALSHDTIGALSVNAIKELNALIAALTDRVAALEAP
jgi:hypothetical protein